MFAVGAIADFVGVLWMVVQAKKEGADMRKVLEIGRKVVDGVGVIAAGT